MELRTEEGTQRIVNYFEKFAQLAVDNKINFMIETPTWRASRDWAAQVIKKQLRAIFCNKYFRLEWMWMS